MTMREVVEDDRLMSGAGERLAGMGPDVTGAAGN